MKQTAVEFIETELKKLNIPTDSGTQVSVIRIIEQAKAMEKERIVNGVIYGNKLEFYDGTEIEIAEQYYNETFKSE